MSEAAASQSTNLDSSASPALSASSQPSSVSLRDGDKLRLTPKEVERGGKRLTQMIADAQSRLRLKDFIYKYASEVETLLKEGTTYDQIASALGDEFGALIKPDTLRRHINSWRAEQRQQSQSASTPTPAPAPPRTAPPAAVPQSTPTSSSVSASASAQPADSLQPAARTVPQPVPQSVPQPAAHPQTKSQSQAQPTAAPGTTSQTGTKAAVPSSAPRGAEAIV